MASIDIRPFEPSTEAYEALAALWTALNPESPRLAGIWADLDRRQPLPEEAPRFVAYRGDQLIAAGEATCPPISEASTLELSLFSRPDADGPAALGAVYDAVMETSAARTPRTLLTYSRDTRPWERRFFESRGFAVVERVACNELDVLAFDPLPHAQRAVDVANAGYEVTTAAALEAAGADWQRALHALDWALVQEVPMRGGRVQRSFEDFCADLEVPSRFTPEATFIAHRTAASELELVGMSQLLAVDGIPGRGFTGLTGVLPAHRRRGIATTLKLAGIAYAREQGLSCLTARNDVGIPMLGLNHALGFETRFHQLTLERSLDA